MPTRSSDDARYAKLTSVPGVEVLGARFLSHRFGPHTHETWAIGAVVKGAQDNAARDGVHQIVAAGELTGIPPGEAHAGKLVGATACEYAMVYVPDALLRQEFRNLGSAHPNLTMNAMVDNRLANRLSSFVRLALHDDAPPLSVQGEWAGLLDGLAERYGGVRRDPTPPPSGRGGLKRAREFLEDHWSQSVTLEQLAGEAQMSATYFCRQFSRAHGLSPHRYQVVLRVNRAKELLVRGATIAEVAAATGFADQSHLGRHLKSCLGVTPGAIADAAHRARTF